MAATTVIATVLVIMLSCQASSAQLSITATTFPDAGNGKPNTFLAPSDVIGSSLLGAGVPSLLWLSVKSSDVTALCQQIVNQGLLSFNVHVTDVLTDSTDFVSVQVENTGGCEASPDESGTEFLWVDSAGRKSALVCPKNAGSIGCGVYMTSAGITQFYNENISGRRRLLATPKRRQALSCGPEAIVGGFILGAGIGFMLGQNCLFIPPPANAFCIGFAISTTIIPAIFITCLYDSSCFPGDAILQLPGGRFKSMAELDVGDKVAVWTVDGSLGYEDVYGFGHRDAMTTSRYYRISMNSSTGLETSLELSGGHFAPISARGIGDEIGGQKKMAYLRAKEIQLGDMMWGLNSGLNDSATTLFTVTGVSVILKQGLYNPFTIGGTIVVNGVVASVHSDWFLDTVFNLFHVTHMLPTAYQVILAPPRMLYNMMGKDLYIVAYNWLDQNLNFVQYISDYSGIIVASIVSTSGVGASFYLLKRSKC